MSPSPDRGRPEQPASSAFVLGGSPGWHGWVLARRSLAAWTLVAAVIVVPLKGLYVATGASMEEGFMMVFPNLVRAGKTPNVDFLHLYGPTSLDALASWFRLFGDTLESQRVFGFAQHLGIITALYTLARASGRAAAAGAGVVAALFVLTPIGLTALAWHGAVALGLWGVVFAARFTVTQRLSDLWWAAGLMGAGLGFRPDLAVACILVIGWVLWSRRGDNASGRLSTAFGGVFVGLLPLWVHIANAGVSASFRGMFLDPVFHLRAGRELPRPPSWGQVDGALQAVAESLPPWWGLPALPASQQLFLWFWAVVLVAIVALVASVWAWRRTQPPIRSRWSVLVAGSLFGVGIVPQALQRPDSTHLAWVAMVSWPLAVPIAALLFDNRRHAAAERASTRAAPTTNATVAAAAMLLLMLVVCPFFTFRTYVLHSRVAVGALPLPFLIERGERHFWVGDPAVARAMAHMIPDLDRLAKPGDRLFVGPGDLRKTVYADTYLYWLFHELEPSTYYIEMDPGLANAPGSRLAPDVSSADFVVLTNTWSGWIEPNTSVVPGSSAANEVVANEFCLVQSYETNLILLFRRCPGGGGLNPADVAGRAPGIGGGGVKTAADTPTRP